MTGEARKADSPADDGVWDELEVSETAPPPAGAETPAIVAGRYMAGAIVAGKYQLVSVLGEGGMGSVWVAKNRTLDVEVALKLMRAELAEDVDGIAERMLQEARAAASIGHPAIIQVFDFGYSELGDPFIAMERLRGESLSQTLRRRQRLSPARAVQTLLPIVDALSAAHASGIVHRDLKPENIFLSRSTGRRLQPKVLDFGIAKFEQRAAERLTRDGAVIGSPAYMAPEQLRGDPGVDARADVWALSVVLYQMLVGRRPFDGDNYHASMWNVAHSEPPPIADHGLDEPELWEILLRGLRKEPGQRTASMRLLGRELAGFLLARGVHDDITDASLRNWFLEEEALAGQAHSFFPSQEPSLRGAGRDFELPRELAISVESSGTRRIEPALPRRSTFRASFLGSGRSWLWLTVGSALLAFGAAGLWAALSGDEPAEEERAPALTPRQRLLQEAASRKPIRPRKVAEDGLPPRPLVAAPRTREAVPEPEPEQRAPAVQSRASIPVPATPSSARRPTKAAPKRAAKSDLKDPFE